MSNKAKIILASVSIFLVLAIGILIYIFFPAIKGSISGKGYLTPEQGQEMYDKGYADGSKNETELKTKINYYMTLVDNLQKDKTRLQNLVDANNNTIVLNDKKIAELETKLQSSNLTIEDYKSQLESSEKNNEELQAKYDYEVSNNVNLKTEVTRLRQEKLELQLNLTNAQNRISELNQSVLGYENFIQGLIAENQVVAKFYYDNSLYSVMVLQKGDKANVSNPSDTTYKKFLGWMVNNEIVDVPNYPINENTTFVAKINTFYDVKFVVDNDQYDTDIVVDGGYSKTPTSPTKAGYVFDGWMIDNVVYDINTYPITQNTVFTAKFVKLNTVKFSYKDNIISTQTIRNNEYATEVTPEVDQYVQFNYWMVNGVRVDISTYPVTSDVIFVANITLKYDVKFMYENSEYAKQIVLSGDCPSSVTPANTTYKIFKGWSLDKKTVIDVTKQEITKATTFYAVIEYYFSVKFKIDDSTLFGDSQIIVNGGYATIPSSSPIKAGYDFDYWTIDKENEVNVTTTKITSDTIFYAKFTKLHTVKFQVKDSIVNTQTIRNNEFAVNQTVTSTDREQFNGWKVNNILVENVSSYPITADTVFVADITYKSQVQFKLGTEIVKTVFVPNGTKTVAPDMSSYTDYTVSYWTLDGRTQVNVSSTIISKDTVFIAKATRNKYTYTFTANNCSEKNNYNSHVNYSYVLSNVSDFNSSNFNGFKVVGTIKINGKSYDVNSSTGSTVTVGGYQIMFSGSYYDSFGVTVYNSTGIDFELSVTLTPQYGFSGL